MALVARTQQAWSHSDPMSRTDRLGFLSRTALDLVAECDVGKPAFGVHLHRHLSLSSLGDSTSRPPEQSLRRERRGSHSSVGEGQTFSAEALKREFSAVESRIEHLMHRNRLPEPESCRREPEAVKNQKGRREREEEEEQEHLAAAAAEERQEARKEKIASRDPRMSIKMKMEQRRGGSSSPKPKRRDVPMMQLHVQRSGGTEKVELVDIPALRSRSMFSDGARASVKSLLEARRHAERQGRLQTAARTSLRRTLSSPVLQGPSPYQMSWEERLEMVQDRKQRHVVENYLHKMNSRRERGAPFPIACQFDEPDF